MATILDLERRGALVRYDARLGMREMEERELFASPALVDWFAKVLPGLTSDRNVEESPAEQLDFLLHKYVAGKTMTYDWQFKVLKPHEHSVWEFKTADIRLFGWFYQRDCFISVVADTKWRTQNYGLVPHYIKKVVEFRTTLDLNSPKCIEGKDPRYVVSNFDYP